MAKEITYEDIALALSSGQVTLEQIAEALPPIVQLSGGKFAELRGHTVGVVAGKFRRICSLSEPINRDGGKFEPKKRAPRTVKPQGKGK